MDKKELQNPALYTNRELSWLLFNKRVLSEARDKQLLLFERLKFLSITASNLDEFFMVRIGSLVDMIHAEYTKKDIAGMSAKEQLDALMEETHKFAALQYSTYNRMLLPQLRANGLNFVEHHEQLTERQAQYVDEYFEENVYPVLTPMAVDSSRISARWLPKREKRIRKSSSQPYRFRLFCRELCEFRRRRRGTQRLRCCFWKRSLSATSASCF